VTRDDLRAVLDRAAAGWAGGDAAAVGDCFAAEVEYVDPYLYHFHRRADLLPFFEPPPGGHHVTWHAILWDDETQTGVVEYTYEGHHRYHGAAIVRLDAAGRIVLWREWQHRDDALDWDARLAGPADDDAVLTAIDHVQLGMPGGGEDAARAFYGEILGLREVVKPAPLAGRGGVWFAGRDVAVHLAVEPDFRPAARSHPAFVVDDLATVRERLAAAGVPIVDDETGLPVERCYVPDPFSNRIELVDAADAGFSLGRTTRNAGQAAVAERS
jgi:catechol 2,3-dioxygenase-like lactoylglutathione lyase family enzyme